MSSFPLFQSHLDKAHRYWETLLQFGDTVVDATCGNGHDTLVLAQKVLKEGKGGVYALDVQSAALEATKKRIVEELGESAATHVKCLQQSHAVFPKEIKPHSLRLIVYNLGYLPGGDKSIVTQTETTLQSLKGALDLVMPGGAISLTAYPGHPEGAREYSELQAFLVELDKKQWSCCEHRFLNRRRAPTLFLLQKSLP